MKLKFKIIILSILILLIGIFYLSYKFEIIDNKLNVMVKYPYKGSNDYVVYRAINKKCSGKEILYDKLEKNELYLGCELDVYVYKINGKYYQFDEIIKMNY